MNLASCCNIGPDHLHSSFSPKLGIYLTHVIRCLCYFLQPEDPTLLKGMACL